MKKPCRFTQAELARIMRAVHQEGPDLAVSFNNEGSICIGPKFAPPNRAEARAMYAREENRISIHNKRMLAGLQLPPSVIYFIRCGDLVKIGYTIKLAYRIRDMQVGSPYPLMLLGIIPGGKSEEQRLHEQLRDHRMKGEWFWHSDALQQELDKILLIKGTDHAVA